MTRADMRSNGTIVTWAAGDVAYGRSAVMAIAFVSTLLVSVVSGMATGHAYLAPDGGDTIGHLFAAMFLLGPAFVASQIVARLFRSYPLHQRNMLFAAIWAASIALGIACFGISTRAGMASALPGSVSPLGAIAEVLAAPLVAMALLTIAPLCPHPWREGRIPVAALDVASDALGVAMAFLWIILAIGKLLL